MTAFMTALLEEITAANLWGVLTPMVPYIGVMVLFALAVYFFRRMIKGTSKAKARI